MEPACTYIRTSTKKQEYGLEAQRLAIAAFAAAENYTIEREFCEQESGKDNDRAQFAAAQAHCRRTGQTLLVSKLDRLGRKHAALERLQDAGIKFRVASMPFATEMVLDTLMSYAKFEGQLISTRTVEGLAVAKAKGVKLGSLREGAHRFSPEQVAKGAKASAAKRRQQAIDLVANLIGDMQAWRAGGDTFEAVADQLNARGDTTPQNRDWNARSVKRALARVA